MLHLHKLIQSVYADYARSLKLLGFKEGAALFASKAGESGKELLTELKGEGGDDPGVKIPCFWGFLAGWDPTGEDTFFSWITVVADLCDLSKYC